jgi:hypothetical protein
MRGSNLLAQIWLRRARVRGRMPGVPSPRLASTAGCRLRGLPVGKACLGGEPVQEVVEAGFFLRAAGGGSLGAPICGVSCGGKISCHR